MAEIAAAPELDGMRSKIFPTNYSGSRARRLGAGHAQRDPDGRARRDARHAAGWRSWIIDRLVTSGVTLADVLADDAGARCLSQQGGRRRVAPGRKLPHGPADDPLAVTTPQGACAASRACASATPR
jgi:5-(hydroxymethyl)furfural/furfural oxidase